jgi:predicted 2-oxoglutarate/Fe(II)-dependent dioxygenase YbiX/peroxiredoxin
METTAPTEPAAQAAERPQAPPPPRKPGFGEMAPAFSVASDVNPDFLFRSLGGRWMVLMFFGTLGHGPSRLAHERIVARRALFDDQGAQFFGVSYDPADRGERGLKNSMPGLRYFWDFDQAVSRLYGTAIEGGYAPTAFLIDSNLRIAAVESVSRIDALLDRLEALMRGPADDRTAPVLTVPRILEPEFCRRLIEHYEQSGGRSSGFMRQVGDKTVPILDDKTKKRRDVTIADPALIDGLRARLSRRLLPMIAEAFVWRATRIERYIVACYSGEDSGFFSRHRDNTTHGTAHRRFAVSINLNDDYDGGELSFPEFGPRTYRPPLGGATVFSCSLLHEATPVTRGLRYATLPFLYDEEGAAIRQANAGSLVVQDPVPDGEG